MSYPIYSQKVLNLISDEIAKYFTCNQLASIFIESGVTKKIDQLPNGKNWMINEAFNFIKNKHKDEADFYISLLIMNLIHPLNNNFDNEKIEQIANKLKKYLIYNNLYIYNIGKEYVIVPEDEAEKMGLLYRKIGRNIPHVNDLKVGPLNYRKDGGLYFRGNIIKMRPQLKTLCILFMNDHNNPVDYSTIRDQLIKVPKRSKIDLNTINKYVSELHKILKKYFRRDVIFNDKKEGYIFNIGKNN